MKTNKSPGRLGMSYKRKEDVENEANFNISTEV